MKCLPVTSFYRKLSIVLQAFWDTLYSVIFLTGFKSAPRIARIFWSGPIISSVTPRAEFTTQSSICCCFVLDQTLKVWSEFMAIGVEVVPRLFKASMTDCQMNKHSRKSRNLIGWTGRSWTHWRKDQTAPMVWSTSGSCIKVTCNMQSLDFLEMVVTFLRTWTLILTYLPLVEKF